jgi:23S rRNA (guanosine2251-2'-O)-methyltransferase
MEHLEGRQSVLAALRAGRRRFQAILIRAGMHEERVQDVLGLAAARGIPVRRAPEAELDALAHGATHGGVLALCSPLPRLSAADLLELVSRAPAPPLLLVLEGIDDARNLGFVIRSAAALGAGAVLVKKHLWDFDPVEIARPASGAYETVPLVQFDDAGLLVRLQQRGLAVIGCLAGAKRSLFAHDLTGPTVLCIGGEKRGLSGAVRAVCDAFVTIPTQSGAPALSLSHAAAIVLAEAWRQRTAPPPGG